MFARFGVFCGVAVSLGAVLLFPACRTSGTHSDATPNPAVIEAGEIAFYDAACWRCHSLGETELPGNPDIENQGPDLALVGDRLDAKAILQSIIKPNAAIAEPIHDHVDANGNSRMPSFEDTLSADMIEGIALFLNANKFAKQRSGTIDVSSENFEKEVLEADEIVLLDFWAEWCVPCHEIDPVLEGLAPEYQGRIKICKINVDDNPDLVIEYVPDNIFPCLILMKNGELLNRQYGTDPKMEIEPFFHQWFRSYLTSTN